MTAPTEASPEAGSLDATTLGATCLLAAWSTTALPGAASLDAALPDPASTIPSALPDAASISAAVSHDVASPEVALMVPTAPPSLVAAAVVTLRRQSTSRRSREPSLHSPSPHRNVGQRHSGPNETTVLCGVVPCVTHALA
ncbi:hypothetical protein QAD02_002042 [Eretmocerus hayati]|uniref:Uncharacterized protein n=1 Tax=Eretmocerus hayati TaxID=131215 RepID=A0ACC2NIR2_9HYME|nr:hypothetical protein QAD02_002042 [Eretmocerus hayati]